jgi:hypothetical protein
MNKVSDNYADGLEARIKELIAERDALAAQLPEGMKHCTIEFKECDKGHGWLTATNWVQHGCPTCENDTLAAKLAEVEKQKPEAWLHNEHQGWVVRMQPPDTGNWYPVFTSPGAQLQDAQDAARWNYHLLATARIRRRRVGGNVERHKLEIIAEADAEMAQGAE